MNRIKSLNGYQKGILLLMIAMVIIFEVKYDDKEETLPFDYGFVCLGMKAYAPIWEEMQKAFTGEDVEVLNIGDSVRARRIIDGVDAGRHLVLNTLDRLGFR